MSDQQFTISNPRKEDTFEDWPIGGSNRGIAKFTHESNSHGERISRTTTNKHGRWCKPKRTVYSQRVRIVDGSDGRTHILSFSSGFLQVTSSDLKMSDFSVFAGDDNYAEYKAMAHAE